MPEGLTTAEHLRYSRHLLIPAVGEAGQLRLKNAAVLLIGAGALGSPSALYLAAAGVGRIGIVDDDRVETSNLQRQILHGESSVGKSKLESAAARLHDVNPHIRIELHAVRLTPANALEIAADYDVIVDGTDNFPTRFLTNDTAFFLKKPLVYGAIHRFSGQSGVFAPHLGGPCYRCLVLEMPAPGAMPSCQEAGVLGVLPGIIGTLQATETLKLLLGIGTVPLGRLTCYDALESRFRSLQITRDPQCGLCGDAPTIHDIANPETRATAACEISLPHMDTITTTELRTILANGFRGLLLDVREPEEYAVAHIPQAQLIPLKTLPSMIDTLPRDREILIHCKAGGRSAKAVQCLLDHGFTDVKNVAGGMDQWLQEEAQHP